MNIVTEIGQASLTDLFDAEWYCANYGIVADASLNPLEHYLTVGWLEGQNPNKFFDTFWYLLNNLDVARSGVNPLVHYFEHGEEVGAWPCRVFDPLWYSKQNRTACGQGRALTHYLKMGHREKRRPNEILDPHAYSQLNPELAAADVDPIIHYLTYGFREDRQLSLEFSAARYRSAYLKGDTIIDPVFHYLTLGRAKGFSPNPVDRPILKTTTRSSIADEIRRFANPGPDFEEFDSDIIKSAPPRAKLVAFYLPQFHTIPQNDEWWGKGFTEWRNTQRGCPRFVGHQQPRIPRDLGFYDLSNPKVLRQQIDLASAAGIHGFCFYYYFFDRQRILETPLNNFLADRSIDFPFCIMWANENWTKRWDGLDQEILIAQHYSSEDEHALLADWSRHFADPRYITAEGRPVLIIYRPGIIPNARVTIDRWRQRLANEFGHQPWLLMAQAFSDLDPRPYGMDGAVEFPPHKLAFGALSINSQLSILDPHYTGEVCSYSQMIERSLGDPTPDFPLIKAVCPSWDNDCRRQGSGFTLHGSSPKSYQRWLEDLVERAVQHPFANEPFVFANAWNEWAEAAYLEPDTFYGSAYLNATARAISGSEAAKTKASVVLVGHDAHRHGAQLLLLNLGRLFAWRFGVSVTFLLLEGGALLERYRQVGHVIVAPPNSPELSAALDQLQKDGLRLAITNTMVTGCVVPELRRRGFRVVSLIHELPRLAREYQLDKAAQSIASHSDVIVCAAEMVANEFRKFVGGPHGTMKILPQGLYQKLEDDPSQRIEVRRKLGLSPDAQIVLGLGHADLRKGIDIFMAVATLAATRDPTLQFVWVGSVSYEMRRWLLPGNKPADNLTNFRHVEFTDDVAPYLSAADVFFLSSREDPFPSTVLEALSFGLPVVGFKNCSGTQDLIQSHGRLLPECDVSAAFDAIHSLINEDVDVAERAAIARRDIITKSFRFDQYGFGLLQLLNPDWRPISVVVPNYNYARYLEARMNSIFNQTMPVFEVIVLDDCSSDDSLAELDRIQRTSGREFSVVLNSRNSGSVMSQWHKGIDLASGEFIWIAEADDLSKPDFLARLTTTLKSDDVLFAFCDSVQIDGEGKHLADSYGYYYDPDGSSIFAQDFTMPARAFAIEHLAVRNLILNVSSMVARRTPFLESLNASLKTLKSYSFAGDWLLYTQLCVKNGKVAFIAESLNIHRRHQQSAVHAKTGKAHISEIRRVHRFFEKAYGKDEAVGLKRTRYLEELHEQFGLGKR